MKAASVIFSILGAIGAIILGAKWLADLNSELGQLVTSLGQGSAFTSYKIASYLLILGGIVGIIAVILLLKKKAPKLFLGIALIVVSVLPLFFQSEALWGLPMLLGGIFAFFIKDK
jgi:hypothetical protein